MKSKTILIAAVIVAAGLIIAALIVVFGLPDAWLATADKPVIYLYPTEPTEVSVILGYDGTLDYTYPAYNGGWQVTAHPDGTLFDADGREYSYLFWEGHGPAEYDFTRGFCVRGGDTVAFLQSTLAQIGLTPREYNEFIVYWLPKMQNNPYNIIAFQGASYTDRAPLYITPAPDSMLRVFMAFYASDKPVNIAPQEFEPFERVGFTVVEWGGSEVK